jgi:16S rRNA (uracil1498-N3)-methyltransferase
MLRVFCQNWDGGDSGPVLGDEEIHHLVRVRRVRAGETVELLNGSGVVASCRVAGTAAKRVDLEISEIRTVAQPALQVHLLVALPKGKTFPSVLHKAVELGVSRITPLLTENSEVPQSRAGQKQDRWESILVEALKQSGNPWLPALDPPIGLADSLAGPVSTERLCAALQPDARPLWDLLGSDLQPQGLLQVFVGPEGDFSPGEYGLLRDAGCRFASLGSLVLKVETAASLMVGALSLWSQAGSS